MNEIYKLVCPCHFGLESITKNEIYDLGYEITEVKDGKVYFNGDAEAIARVNINSRTIERVLLEVARFKATTFEELFQCVKLIDLKKFLNKNSKFTISKATSIRSKLFSTRDIQSITKKAFVDNLMSAFCVDVLPENEKEYKFRINFLNDEAEILLDTSGDSLHKRGYRLKQGLAPIAENLAAAIILLSNYKKFGKDKFLIDPFCGSGTIPIEAALISANIAPGMNRHFKAEEFENIVNKKIWKEAFIEAKENVDYDFLNNKGINIGAYDIDNDIIPIARENAIRAGVEKLIHFEKRDVKDLSSKRIRGIIITNPPYGERLEDINSILHLYKSLGDNFKKLPNWMMYVISGFEDARKYLGKEDKNRKVYNGMIKSYIYMYGIK
ncbi:MAG: class I SAM-dependent RNA methyltransferase [Eubacteriales bacterium]|nr:class I SAM-dependent RNA methyltransferase [Eubacteriales bacterium]